MTKNWGRAPFIFGLAKVGLSSQVAVALRENTETDGERILLRLLPLNLSKLKGKIVRFWTNRWEEFKILRILDDSVVDLQQF